MSGFKSVRDVCVYIDTCRKHGRPITVLQMRPREWADVSHDPAILTYMPMLQDNDTPRIMGVRIEVRE